MAGTQIRTYSTLPLFLFLSSFRFSASLFDQYRVCMNQILLPSHVPSETSDPTILPSNFCRWCSCMSMVCLFNLSLQICKEALSLPIFVDGQLDMLYFLLRWTGRRSAFVSPFIRHKKLRPDQDYSFPVLRLSNFFLSHSSLLFIQGSMILSQAHGRLR